MRKIFFLLLSSLFLPSTHSTHSMQNDLIFNQSFSSDQEDSFFRAIQKYIYQTKKHSRQTKIKKKKNKKFFALHLKDKIAYRIKFAITHFSHTSHKTITTEKKELYEYARALCLALNDDRDTIKGKFDAQNRIYSTLQQPKQLNLMEILSDALFIKSKTNNELINNRNLAKDVSRIFHSDKNVSATQETQEQNENFFKYVTPSLLRNEKSEKLANMLRVANEQLVETLERNNNISLLVDLAYKLSNSPLMIGAKYTAYKITEWLLPSKSIKKQYAQICNQDMQTVALNLEHIALEIQAKKLSRQI